MADTTHQPVWFKPFKDEHIGREWKPAFGAWRIEEGRLCHYFPEKPGDNVKAMIGASPISRNELIRFSRSAA